MSTISEKIARLLALASSPYEAEAKEALLKARQLMAEHKLRPEDINPQENSRVIRAHTGVSTTKLSTPLGSQPCQYHRGPLLLPLLSHNLERA